MYKPYAVIRRAAVALCALLAASAFVAAPLKAAESEPAKPAGQEPRSQVAAAPEAPKARAARAPEKSLEEQRAADGPWMKGSNWLSFRAGYAKATGSFAGGGLAGYGIAYQHMISPRWAFGGSVHHDLLGHLGNAYEISVPLTLETSRHFNWHTALRPYVGFGGGYYFHKYYRTGTNYTGRPGGGGYVNFGANLPVDQRHLLGLDTRVSFVRGADGAVNPVFGVEKSSQTLWSVKLNWALAY